MDPWVSNRTQLNATVSPAQAAAANWSWHMAHTLPANTTNRDREAFLRRAWSNLSLAASMPGPGTSLLVRALSAGDCSEPDWCVGVELRRGSGDVTRAGRCLCRIESE